MNEEIKPGNLRIHSRADELIACLEGEIAKRDETIARLEPQLNRAIQANYDLREELAACRVAVENCDVFRARIAELEDDLKCAHSMLAEVSKAGMALRAELAALKAQEPVAEVKHGPLDSSGWPEFVQVKTIGDFDLENLPNGMKFYAAPVSEAKAQCVVMPERAIKDGGKFSTELKVTGWNACLDAVARLNAAPVQQVSVPDGWRRAVYMAEECLAGCLAAPDIARSLDTETVRKIIAQLQATRFSMLAAAPAAPAADAGLGEALDYQALFDAIAAATSVYANGAINISVQAFRDALAAHCAKGVV